MSSLITFGILKLTIQLL